MKRFIFPKDGYSFVLAELQAKLRLFSTSNKVKFNGVKYGYLQNLQGDIVGIIDSLGNEVVKYTYDAWGKPLSCTGTMAASLGKLNPFRYRGYVFDEETGLYYLRNRYYASILNRFINADVIVANDSFFSDNLFCYCLNSPIINKDDSGYGIYIQLRGGNKARIDNANSSTLEKRHIHIYENGKEYCQNDDGSPHKGDKGSPSNSVKKELLEKGEWDWDGNRKKYIKELKDKLKNAQSVVRVWSDMNGYGVVLTIGDTDEFYCDEDFIEAGGKIEGWNAYLPNTFMYITPLFEIPVMPSFQPSFYPFPAFGF